jgi:hypothetical protein
LAQAGKGGPAAAEFAAADNSVQANDQATREKLAQRIEATLQDMPLAEVLQFVAEQFDIETFTQRKDLEEAGITLDAPVTLKLKRVRGDMLLELALRQVSPDLSYVVRDGILIIATRDSLSDSQTVRVYNCRDLLSGAGHPARAAAGGAVPGGAAPGVAANSVAAPGVAAQAGGTGSAAPVGGPAAMGGMGMGMGGGMGGSFRGPPVTRGDQLQVVIRATVLPESWDDAGGSGTMEEFGGLLVVNQSEAVHDRVEKLLQMLREAAAKK